MYVDAQLSIYVITTTIEFSGKNLSYETSLISLFLYLHTGNVERQLLGW